MAIGYTANQYPRHAALSRIAEILDTPISPRYQSLSATQHAEPIRGSTICVISPLAYDTEHGPVLKISICRFQRARFAASSVRPGQVKAPW